MITILFADMVSLLKPMKTMFFYIYIINVDLAKSSSINAEQNKV